MNALYKKALAFAKKAHGDQKRKYTGMPYIGHPIEVARILSQAGIVDENILAAALMHDVLEDTPVTSLEMNSVFGYAVTGLVLEVTDISCPNDGNRAQRKAIDRNHLFQASAAAQTIKLADLISNTKSIVQYDPAFAKTYIREKIDLLRVLTKGDIYLYQKALGIALKAAEELGIDVRETPVIVKHCNECGVVDPHHTRICSQYDARDKSYEEIRQDYRDAVCWGNE